METVRKDDDSMLWRMFHVVIFGALAYVSITEENLLIDFKLSDILIAFLFFLAAISTIIIGYNRIKKKEESRFSNTVDYLQIAVSSVAVLSMIYNVVK